MLFSFMFLTLQYHRVALLSITSNDYFTDRTHLDMTGINYVSRLSLIYIINKINVIKRYSGNFIHE